MRIDQLQTGAGERPPETNFAGDVRVAGYYRRAAPSTLAGATVSLGPRARTPWKTNPCGQTLVILSGRGVVGSGDGTVKPVKAGDIIWWSPGERHWEGAAPDEPMTYVAIQEEGHGAVMFGEAVSDAEYDGARGTA